LEVTKSILIYVNETMKDCNESMLDTYKELIGQMKVKDEYIEGNKDMTLKEKIGIIRHYI